MANRIKPKEFQIWLANVSYHPGNKGHQTVVRLLGHPGMAGPDSSLVENSDEWVFHDLESEDHSPQYTNYMAQFELLQYIHG